jgi:hypothetical protein
MAAKIHRVQSRTDQTLYVFHCPGCGYGHPFEVPRWSWNGSMDRPTFIPSLWCNKSDPASSCHSVVTDGKIRFLDECFHNLKGQTVEIPDWED